MPDVHAVEVAQGLREAFFRRHRRDRRPASDPGDALVRLGGRLRADPFIGAQVPKKLFPRDFRAYDNLWKVDLSHGFRAVYTVIGRSGRGVRVAVDRICDHDEPDALFGYA